MNQVDALEAAKLAAMVGGQLKKIDQYTTERSTNPANKINIQNFINQVKDPRQTHYANYLVQTPAGYAPPPPEDFVQSQVPDISVGSLPTQIVAPQPQLQTIPAMSAPASIPAHTLSTSRGVPETPSEGELVNLLKSIDKTLADMLTYMKEKLSNE